MASVSIEDLFKSYGDTQVIKGVDLTIADGEFIALVGPSGCGKSTLLRIVAGLEEITSGTLKIQDRVVNDVAPRDRGVAMVFQSYALYPHMTVRRNMGFGLEIQKVAKDEIRARVEEAATLLDLLELLDRLPKQLSGGQRQRVAIGRAIVRDPEVFLFDEPLSNLDASLRTQMRVELKKLHRRLKTTMIYVTHDQIEAMTLADRIAILHEGLLQQVGTPQQVYNDPENRFVAGFIGSPSMNFLRGEFDAENLAFKVGPTSVPVQVKGVPVELGIRPQHLFLSEESKITLPCTIDVIEPMGWEAYVHATLLGKPVVAHLRSDELHGVTAGDTVHLGVAPEHLYFFDTNGQRLRAEQIAEP